MPCNYIDPDDWTKKNWLLLKLYEIRDPDPTNIPIDELYETETISDPSKSISASWSSGTCSVSMSGSLWAGTSNVSRYRKVWNQINVWLILRSDWILVYDVPTTDIKITAKDLSD